MVERSEVDQMAKFLAASQNLEGILTETTSGMSGYSGMNNGVLPSSNHIAPPSTLSGSQNVAEMKNILEAFYSATDRVVSEASYDRPLRTALATQQTHRGARIGSWDIVVREEGKRKFYDVVHTSTDECIAVDLLLYEAAYGLVRQLNEGGRINSKEVIELLQEEQKYAGAIHDMVLYKHHLTKTPNSPRAGIYEARYGAAKRLAVSCRDQVRRLSESF